ncbi:hypothetical protein BOTBODRAFT_30297 [Botryobasidium botryosum FD-172 SS1]|uniref:Uncharacterized protein n=1 Tax=Botryobasidium botryosum (strain FD-172 SS1) TaxID=930990 RepID=A0A067MZI0_BOTB1|nr:hypothetical protein BOTBODRAFT_30297 [Botryobasidium botryosum FD-172 SS1]
MDFLGKKPPTVPSCPSRHNSPRAAADIVKEEEDEQHRGSCAPSTSSASLSCPRALVPKVESSLPPLPFSSSPLASSVASSGPEVPTPPHVRRPRSQAPHARQQHACPLTHKLAEPVLFMGRPRGRGIIIAPADAPHAQRQLRPVILHARDTKIFPWAD